MNRIKTLREEFNYTQQDLSNKLNCSKSVIGLYENETRKPSMEVLIKLSEIFNCSIDYILGKSDVRNPEKSIDIDDIDVAFANGIKGLNETNKMIIKNTLEALLAKQEKDNKTKEDK